MLGIRIRRLNVRPVCCSPCHVCHDRYLYPSVARAGPSLVSRFRVSSCLLCRICHGVSFLACQVMLTDSLREFARNALEKAGKHIGPESFHVKFWWEQIRQESSRLLAQVHHSSPVYAWETLQGIGHGLRDCLVLCLDIANKRLEQLKHTPMPAPTKS